MDKYDADYQYAEWENTMFVIDRSDSMDSDYVRRPTKPQFTFNKGHKVRSAKSIGADKWVDTFDKFIGQLFAVVFGLFLMSCGTDIVTDEPMIIGESNSAPTRLLSGSYQVSHKTHELADGTILYFAPMGSNASPSEIDGWFSESTFTFTADSLVIAQLTSSGWSEGSVSVKWENGMPKRVGCRWVESVSENRISWWQNDVIITNYLIKM